MLDDSLSVYTSTLYCQCILSTARFKPQRATDTLKGIVISHHDAEPCQAYGIHQQRLSAKYPNEPSQVSRVSAISVDTEFQANKERLNKMVMHQHPQSVSVGAAQRHTPQMIKYDMS